jgi:multicomponent Na+:H+ antiporter subunit G
MSVFLNVLACLFLLAGAALLVAAAWGVIVLPDALARQHAATKAGTLALVFISLGAGCAMPEGEWAWRLGLIVVFLWITLPLSSHLLARAAMRESAEHREAAARAPLRQTG